MTTLNMVRNRGLVYPQADADYDILSTLKVPINSLSLDYLPVLSTLCHKHKVKVKLVDFEDLELSMLTKLSGLWPNEVVNKPKSLHTSYSKADKLTTKADKLVRALRRWYAKHYISTEVVVKRRSKATSLEIRKTWKEQA